MNVQTPEMHISSLFRTNCKEMNLNRNLLLMENRNFTKSNFNNFGPIDFYEGEHFDVQIIFKFYVLFEI